jgi:hypothetical protein
MFGNTYLCEGTFSIMKFIKSRYRCSLTDESLQHFVRLGTTNITVDIPALVKGSDNPQCSHEDGQKYAIVNNIKRSSYVNCE